MKIISSSDKIEIALMHFLSYQTKNYGIIDSHNLEVSLIGLWDRFVLTEALTGSNLEPRSVLLFPSSHDLDTQSPAYMDTQKH